MLYYIISISKDLPHTLLHVTNEYLERSLFTILRFSCISFSKWISPNPSTA